MANSIKANYFYNLALTVSGLLFPLVTFPYITRVIQADGVGLVHFYQGIVDYIVLFSSLGIPVYAIREVARVRDDIKKRDAVLAEILILNILLSLVAYLFAFTLGFTVDRILENLTIYLILCVSIILNAIGCSWFYQGIEDFKFIAIRGILVRFICLISLFVFVHTKSDLIAYAIITILGNVGNNIINFLYLRHYVNLSDISLRELRPFRHLLPSIRIFALNLVISIYVNLDSIMLGFLSTNSAVGYYTGATRLTKTILGVINSLQTTMIPRFSYLATNDTMDKFNILIQKVFDFVLAVSLPMAVGLAIMAPTLINLFCGEGYAPAIITLEIISPIILLISMSGIPCFQILYPLGKEKIAICATAVGALVNFTLNMLFIPDLAENGAAIATVIAEASVTIMMFILGRKYIKINKYTHHYSNCIFATILMGALLLLIKYLEFCDWVNLILMPLCGISVYFGYLFLRKDTITDYIKNYIKNK